MRGIDQSGLGLRFHLWVILLTTYMEKDKGEPKKKKKKMMMVVNKTLHGPLEGTGHMIRWK